MFNVYLPDYGCMARLVDLARKKYDEDGLLSLITSSILFCCDTFSSKFVRWYNTEVRPLLPRRSSYPTVADEVRMGSQYQKRLLDDVVPWRTPFDNPRWGTWNNYEPELIDALRSTVESDDRVVIVGAGRGVTSVVAGNQTGASGSVISYEANAKRADSARQTVKVNGISDHVEIRRGVIGEAVHVPEVDNLDELTATPADSLPDCDVLELDCEGAERQILRNVEIRPREIIVETHGCYGAPESEIRSLLSDMGYTVVNRDPQDEERNIVILTATTESRRTTAR